MHRNVIVSLLFTLGPSVLADVPQQINHQGVVKVNGTPFDGAGLFKFAIADGPGANLWTNDNSNLVLNGVPNTFENVTVIEGVYSVLLGGAGPTYAMEPIPPSIFDGTGLKLRIWFNNGVDGFQELTPSHPLVSSPYAHRAANAGMVGEVRMWAGPIATIPPGWRHCDGAAVLRTTYTLLFDAIGDIYGDGDQTTTFNLPNFRNRSPMGAEADTAGAPTTTVQGSAVQSGGAATHTLTTAQIPAHNHSGTTSTGNPVGYRLMHQAGNGRQSNHVDGYASGAFTDFNDGDWPMRNHTHNFTTNTDGGGGGAHNIVHPYFAIVYIIYTGVAE